MPRLFLFLFFYGSFYAVMAQEDPAAKTVIARLADRLPEAGDLSELTAQLSFYREHPIDLNHTNPDQLKELIFLSALQITNFFIHLKENGSLNDLLALQGIDGFDLNTISQLLPFVTLKTTPAITMITLPHVIKHAQQEMVLRYGRVLEKQKGYRDLPGSRYLGSPDKLLFRYQYRLDDLIAVSLVGKKDAGESFFKGINKTGFDFISGNIALFKTGRFSKIILGDYSLQFGQGLTLWTGTSFGKGPDVSGVAKNGGGLKPYTSANESSFFRGLATQITASKHIDFTAFLSSRSLDASLSKASEGDYTLSAINMSGLHRTVNEISHKQNLHQLLYGGAAAYHSERLSAGIVIYHTDYEHRFITGKPLYKQFAFTGKTLTNLGFNYGYTFRNIHFFGETASSIPDGTAWLSGAMASITPTLSVVLLHRSYAKKHVNFYSQALGEGSGATSEKGFYGGIHFSPNRKWDLSLYGDLYDFPWAKYRIDRPSAGSDITGSIRFSPVKKWQFGLKLGSKKGEQNDTSGLPVNPVVQTQKENGRLTADWQMSKKFSFGNRVEITHYKKGKREAEYGYMIYQDAAYHPLSSRLSANARIAYFNTLSFDSRIYAYEDDVLNGSGSGLYNGRGLRSYLNISYRLSRHLRTWCRYAAYYYPDKDTTGSGLEEINGKRKSDYKVQIRYQF